MGRTRKYDGQYSFMLTDKFQKNWKPVLPGCPPPQCRYSKEEMDADHRRQIVGVAEEALAYYNKSKGKGKDYVLVEPLDGYGKIDATGIWYHCNFTAKPKAENEESFAKLFFAEKGGRTWSSARITGCRILEGGRINIGCGMCRKLSHPKGGFRRGLYGNSSRVLRPGVRGFQ